ncbi:MAG: hypothetical protein QG583_173 [Patescibacteria group bacterium]|nr:hypothetical protein [Patescibacteria group bacterium]
MNKNTLQRNTGFTLIETVIYIGLFAILMGGALTSVYAIIEGNNRNQNKAMVQEEGTFILGKIDWALTGVSSASVDAAGKILTITKSNFPNNPIVITVNEQLGNITIKRGIGLTQGLNNSNVRVECPPEKCFNRDLATGDGINPENISVDILVNSRTSDGLPYSQEFSTVKFIRK